MLTNLFMQKKIFTEFLKTIRPENWQKLLEKFEQYHSYLVETNKVINLISRKSNPDDWWTTHFLDSLLIEKVATLKGKLLDFGTGGGLPGIPLAIINPELKVYLMDATLKKVNTINKAAEVLGLTNAKAFQARLEENKAYQSFFDVLVCRSVKIFPEYKKPLLKMMKKHKIMYFYKAVDITDMNQFKNKIIHDLSTDSLGNRLIIEVKV